MANQTVARPGSIGAISIFALVIILCLAVLSVLTMATAHSSLVLSQRQAEATHQMYANEVAAQAFVADVDAALSASGGSISSIEGRLASMGENAKQAANGATDVSARVDGDRIIAEFGCEGGRTLRVTLAVEGGTYRIDSWRTIAIVNEEPPMGSLYLGG